MKDLLSKLVEFLKQYADELGAVASEPRNLRRDMRRLVLWHFRGWTPRQILDDESDQELENLSADILESTEDEGSIEELREKIKAQESGVRKSVYAMAEELGLALDDRAPGRPGNTA